MHGDDVATTVTHIAGEAAVGTIHIVMDIIKFWIEEKRKSEQINSLKAEEVVLNGEQKLLSSLKKGGEITSVSIPAEDYQRFKNIDKNSYNNDIAYVAVPRENSEYVDLHFLKSDEAAVKSIMDGIVDEKLASPGQEFKMVTMEKEAAEAFNEYCAEKNIPVNMLETEQGKIKCVFKSTDEQKVQKAISDVTDIRKDLVSASIEVKKDDNGKLKFLIGDAQQKKNITMRFSTKENLERVLQEQFGYNKVKAIAASSAIKLTDEQNNFFRSGSKLSEMIDTYESDIKFENESLLVNEFRFAKIKLNGEDEKLLISDKSDNFVVFSSFDTDRDYIEEKLRKELNIKSTEKINALLEKAEHTGYAAPAEQINYSGFNITRFSKNGAEVTLGTKKVDVDISDKKLACQTLAHEFGITENKAEKIIKKAQSQSVTHNMLNQIKGKSALNIGNTIKDKKLSKGAR